MSLRDLKNLRARARRKLGAWRERRNEHQRAKKRAQDRHRDLQKLKAAKKAQKRALELRYYEFGPKSDEQRAHELKTHIVDLHKDIERINESDREVVKRIRNLGRFIHKSGRNVRYYIHVRLPHIAKQIKDKRKELADSGWNPTGSNIVTFDGKPTPEWIAYRHEVSRAAGWSGYQTSGYRTPEYSEQLCYQICGAPFCPGRCAGRSSNHTQHAYPGGAADVTDYYTYGSLQKALDGRVPGVVLINALPYDLVHYSASGG